MLKKIFKWSLYFVSFIAAILFAFYIHLATLNGNPAMEYKIFTEQKKRPLVIAHRGGKGLAPENTMKAFQNAYDLGVDVLELDIHAAKDGTLVVIHDETVDRTTDGKGAVINLNYSEIEKLDAGYHWTNDGGKTFPFRGKGVKIPTLREVFEKFPDIIINIEPKSDMPAPVDSLCLMLKEFNRKDKVIVGSFNDSILQSFRTDCKGVATSASPSEVSSFLARYEVGLADNFTPKMQALQTPPGIGGVIYVTENYVKAAHELNLQVHVWTINDGEEMKKFMKIGVDGIMTDYPDRLLSLLRES